MRENSGEILGMVDDAYIKRVIKAAIDETGLNDSRANRVEKMARGFLEYLQNNMEIGERMPLALFDPQKQQEQGLFFEQTEVGLVIMRMASIKKPIPVFNSEDEEWEFWETHSSVDYFLEDGIDLPESDPSSDH